MLENQLFAPALNGVIDFCSTELAKTSGIGSSHPLGQGADEEPIMQSKGARQSQNQ